MKIKIKSYGGNVNTNFKGKKIPKENISCKCLSLIMLDVVIKVNKKYSSQTPLENCNYEIKKNKLENRVNDDFVSSSSDESDSEFDTETECEPDNESNNEPEKSPHNSDSTSKNPLKKSDNESKNLFS